MFVPSFRKMATIDEEIKSKFMNDKHRFVTNMMFTAAWLKNWSTEQLRPFGISMQQYNILRILRGAGDWLPMNDVKNRMIEKSPNATRLADKLLNKGLIERKGSGEDRRIVLVKITKKGLELLEEADNNNQGFEEIMNRINNKDAKAASTLLDKLRG